MDLRHLKYFVAVVEEQSYTKAAERLFISQPPLSRQIKTLETNLGVQLFESGSRPIKTTEAGHFLYQHAIKLLSNAEEIKTMTQRVGTLESTFTIGFVGSLLYGLLPKTIYLFRQQQPKLQINLLEMNTKQQIKDLKEGKIDVGIGRLRFPDPAISRVLLRKEPLFVAVHAQHRLADSEQGVYLSTIIDEKILLFPNFSKPNFSTQVRNLFFEHGFDPNHLIETREIQLALGLVAAAEGISIVPESAHSIQIPNLKFIPLLDDAAVSPIFLITRSMDEDPKIQSFKTCIYAAYNEEVITFDRNVES